MRSTPGPPAFGRQETDHTAAVVSNDKSFQLSDRHGSYRQSKTLSDTDDRDEEVDPNPTRGFTIPNEDSLRVQEKGRWELHCRHEYYSAPELSLLGVDERRKRDLDINVRTSKINRRGGDKTRKAQVPKNAEKPSPALVSAETAIAKRKRDVDDEEEGDIKAPSPLTRSPRRRQEASGGCM